MMPSQTQNPAIVRTPGVVGGKPRIAGRRISVQHVVLKHERAGVTPEEIAADYDLSLADVYAALEYYHRNRTEIDQAIRDDDAFIDQFEQQQISPAAH